MVVVVPKLLKTKFHGHGVYNFCEGSEPLGVQRSRWERSEAIVWGIETKPRTARAVAVALPLVW